MSIIFKTSKKFNVLKIFIGEKMYVYPYILFGMSVFFLLFKLKPVCSSTSWLFIWTQSYTQIKKLHCFISTCFSSLFSPTFDDFLRLIFSLTFLHLKLKVIFISNKKYFSISLEGKYLEKWLGYLSWADSSIFFLDMSNILNKHWKLISQELF